MGRGVRRPPHSRTADGVARQQGCGGAVGASGKFLEPSACSNKDCTHSLPAPIESPQNRTRTIINAQPLLGTLTHPIHKDYESTYRPPTRHPPIHSIYLLPADSGAGCASASRKNAWMRASMNDLDARSLQGEQVGGRGEGVVCVDLVRIKEGGEGTSLRCRRPIKWLPPSVRLYPHALTGTRAARRAASPGRAPRPRARAR